MARLLLVLIAATAAALTIVPAAAKPDPNPDPAPPGKRAPTTTSSAAAGTVAAVTTKRPSRPNPNRIDCSAVCAQVTGPVTHLSPFSTTVTQTVVLPTAASTGDAAAAGIMTDPAAAAAGTQVVPTSDNDDTEGDDASDDEGSAANVDARPVISRVCTCAPVDCKLSSEPITSATYYPVGWIDCETIVGEQLAIPTATAVTVFSIEQESRFGGKQCTPVTTRIDTTDCPCVFDDAEVECSECGEDGTQTCTTSVRAGCAAPTSTEMCQP